MYGIVLKKINQELKKNSAIYFIRLSFETIAWFLSGYIFHAIRLFKYKKMTAVRVIL